MTKRFLCLWALLVAEQLLPGCADPTKLDDLIGRWEFHYAWESSDSSCAGSLADLSSDTIAVTAGVPLFEPCAAGPPFGEDERCGIGRVCGDDGHCKVNLEQPEELDITIGGLNGDPDNVGWGNGVSLAHTGPVGEAVDGGIVVQFFWNPIVAGGHSRWTGNLAFLKNTMKGSLFGDWANDRCLHEPCLDATTPLPCDAGHGDITGEKR